VSELFDEIEAELRSDRLKAFWDRYGSAIIIVLLAIVVLVAGTNIYSSYRTSQNIKASERYEALIEQVGDANQETSIQLFSDFILAEDNGYGKIAAFHKARLLHQSGDTDSAVEAYDILSDDGSLPTALNALAELSAASLLVGSIPASDLDARLQGLLRPDNAYRHSARELAGLAYFLSEEYLTAREIYDMALSDNELPESLRARIIIMRGLVVDELLNNKS
tara:strand:+ start:1715 stop:2380 length:666 start_codon:yes stop_codon:yes gene_type:complete